MPFIGNQPAKVPLTSADITDGIITSAKIADGTIVNADINASAAIATTKLGAGAVLQVVNATYSTSTTSSSSTFADTGLTASITPSSTSSKILIIVEQSSCGKATNDTTLSMKLVRNSTDICAFAQKIGYTGNTNQIYFGNSGASYLDSPNTTSSVTYKTQFMSFSNNAVVVVQDNSGVSTITLIEIKG